ncbi:tRNA (adenosine(37)-N6)-dimethylallyltransferase MiaA [uncultured Sunxiuqinia sp.]|uniref:tRNA (adenosine(37)-N6)-dimethylallyltransferase MiaA n=1 Tax=uncultured Sunxiuqinia sp. TaxID=1573825 RepID=UPI002AA93020|nr:tRNA (adenosine(37)-N6)-dimethylallyltransferase MiaA [uncultured Sunxiuqinia sp.]
MNQRKYHMLTILGPTASGKTTVAAHAAKLLDGEIISADSRQIYRGMDLGTGKDYEDYEVDGQQIPYHLIDIVDAGFEYNVYLFHNEFLKAYNEINGKGKIPILCGGSGLYIEAVLNNYKLIQVPKNLELRSQLEDKSLEELAKILEVMKPELHNTTDTENHRRVLRAIEIETYMQNNPELSDDMPQINSLVVGVKFDRENRRKRITERLEQRLEDGMLDEVQRLLDKGLKPEQLTYYGLEYRYLTLHLIGEISYDEMFTKLEIAIHQFAKRQMTWFRRMEKHGTQIHWLDGFMSLEDKILKINKLLNS